MASRRHDIILSDQPTDVIPLGLEGETPVRDERAVLNEQNCQNIYHVGYTGYQCHLGEMYTEGTYGSPVRIEKMVVGLRGSWNAIKGDYSPQPNSVYEVKSITFTHDGPTDWALAGYTACPPGGSRERLWWRLDNSEWETVGCGPPTPENPTSRIRIRSRNFLDYHEIQEMLSLAKYDHPHAHEWVSSVSVSTVAAPTNSKCF
jgi:hypothetical protein